MDDDDDDDSDGEGEEGEGGEKGMRWKRMMIRLTFKGHKGRLGGTNEYDVAVGGQREVDHGQMYV